MDSYLNIASLAFAIAALVPVLTPGARIRLWTVTAGALSLVVLLVAYQTYKEYSEWQTVKTVKTEILTVLAKHKTGLTFEQIYDSLYYRDYDTADAALDSLVEDGQLSNEKMQTQDSKGNKYVVRLYFKPAGSPMVPNPAVQGTLRDKAAQRP